MRLMKEKSTSPEEIFVVNQWLGEESARAIYQFAKEQEISLAEDVHLIAGQAQTIWYLLLPDLFPD